MKFPSLGQLWQSFLAVCKRFAIPILYAILATIVALLLTVKGNDFATEQMLAKFVYLGNFGLALSFAFCLYSETTVLTTLKKTIGNGVIFLVLILIYFSLAPVKHQADVFVLLILGFSFHLLVAFSAFYGKSKEVGFWQINKTFFLRFATSALYSAVLFAGLSIALLSIHTLFDIRWDAEIYFRLWIIIVGLFNTIFFFAGVPQPLEILNQDYSYPKALKVFTQYVLIPLASIYLLILLAYEVKIIFEWSLPTSSVAILILGYAVFGMLSILLVHPVRNEEGNKWIKLYSKSFYLLMLPLLVLLAVAIIKRISDYGVTESRYLLIVLSLWLTFITFYFLIKGREHIRIIPISLFVFSLIIVLGPWSIKSVSLQSQSKRLANYIAQKTSTERNDEIRSVVRYLQENYGSQSLQPFVKVDLKAIEEKKNRANKGIEMAQWELQRTITDTVLTSLNIDKIPSDRLTSQQKQYSNAEKGIIDVKGALQLVEVNSNFYIGESKKRVFTLNNKKLSFYIDSTKNLVLSDANNVKIVFNLQNLLKELRQHKTFKPDTDRANGLLVPSGILTIEHNAGNYIFKLRLEELTAFYPLKATEKLDNVYYTGYLIVYPKL